MRMNFRLICHNVSSAAPPCNRNIEKTPLCKVDATLPGVRGASGVRNAGGVDEQKGIRPARSFADERHSNIDARVCWGT